MTVSSEEFVGDIFLDAEGFERLKKGGDTQAAAMSLLSALGKSNKDFDQLLLLMVGGPSAKLQPVGVWPEGAKPERAMLSAVQGSTKTGRLILENLEDSGAALAVPVKIDDRLQAVFGAVLSTSNEASIRLAIDQLQWASGWVEVLSQRGSLSDVDGLSRVIALLATSLHHKRFQESATAVVTELANTLSCERVSIGFMKGRHCKLRALSNSANFQKKAALISGIEAAMEEAIDQQNAVIFPETTDLDARVTRAHAALAKAQDSRSVASFPLTEDKRVIGALTLEKNHEEGFDATTLKIAEYSALLLGPVLDVKRREDRWLSAKALDSFGKVLGRLIGPKHWGLKLGTLGLIAFGLFCYFATGPYRITADTVLEGKIQRSVTVPLAGFLAEAPVRAGDMVKEGQVLALIDDRDLRLERSKWLSQKKQQEREYSQALAGRQRTETAILQSQINQAEAQLALLDQQLERMRILAPFAGLVVSGDLSQALGAPLERGDVLFEVAPLAEFRVVLNVDERDIRDIAPDQEGHLVLSAFPDGEIPIRVERITPISTAAEGENFFTVEASLVESPSMDLRPGMEGVAKIFIREERLVKIWTRRTWLWLRLWAWTWWP